MYPNNIPIITCKNVCAFTKSLCNETIITNNIDDWKEIIL